jgi:hypothetical protein
MSYDNISSEVPKEKLDQFKQNVKEMDEAMPFTINLTPAQRRSLPIMGDKTVAFVEKSLEFANNNQQFVPPYLKLNEFSKDLVLSKDLKSLMNILVPFTEKIMDTYYAAGAEALNAALTFYNSVKQASKAKIPGSDEIARELQKRYK